MNNSNNNKNKNKNNNNNNNNGSRKRPRNNHDNKGHDSGGGDAAAVASTVAFVPCSTWKGVREGYFFGTGDQGTGYYRDRNGDAADSAVVRTTKIDDVSIRRRVVIAEDRNETHMVVASSRKRNNTSDTPTTTTTTDAEALLAQAEESVAAEGKTKVLELSAKGIQLASVSLQKALEKNQMLRVKYPDDPSQYMESEVTLYECITSLQACSASPETLYLELTKAEIPATLLQLAAQHENTDLVTAIWAVWAEWIDPNVLQQDNHDDDILVVARSVVALTQALLQHGTDILMESLGRLFQQEGGDTKQNNKNDDEDDDVGQGVSHILTIVEHVLELDAMLPPLMLRRKDTTKDDNNMSLVLDPNHQSVTKLLCSPKWGLVAWLFEQASVSSSSSNNRWYDRSLEILALLAPREELYDCVPDWSKLTPYHATWSSATKPKEDSSSLNGMEVLLQGVGQFRKRQPATEAELDGLENMCMILDAALTYSPANVAAFLEAQGCELVVRCLKERVHAGGLALKWLDFSGSQPVHRQACVHLVTQASALKYLMPLWMDRHVPKMAILPGTSKKEIKKRKKEWNTTMEQTIIRILYTLTRHLPEQDPQDSRARFICKFVEDSVKCDRLVELLLSYDQKARAAEYAFYRSDVEDELGQDNEDVVTLAALEAKLAGGGEFFNRLGAVAAFLCCHSKQCHATIATKLRQYQSGMSLVTAACEEFSSLLLGDSDQKRTLETYLQQLL